MAEILDEHPTKEWSFDMICTGKGNGDEYKACGALIRIYETDVYNSNTIVRPFPAVRCPKCDAATDLTTTDIDAKKYQELREKVRYD